MTTITLEQPSARSDLEQLERRHEPRVRAVSMIVRVTRAHDTGLFRARNISDAGMMLVAHVPFEVGERVWIELSDHVSVHGKIEWCEDEFCGVQFDSRIDSAALLKLLAAEKRECRRSARRLPVKRLATAYSECGIRAVTITDVSPRGVGLAHNGSLRAGVVVTLVLENGLKRGGAVCWSEDGHAGVRLVEPFTREELESARHI